MGNKPGLSKTDRGGTSASKPQAPQLEDMRFLFFGAKVLNEMKILARLASSANWPQRGV